MKQIHFNYHHTHHFKIQKHSQKILWISLVLTLIFAFLELFGGIWSKSLALISDSFHMFSDVVALVLSMIAIFYASKKPTERFTYGFLRVEILSAFLNGLFLIGIAIFIIYEAIIRIFHPENIDFRTMIGIAIVGLIINIILTIILMQSLKHEENLNIKSALWHFLWDLLNSIGVIVTALLVKFTNLVIFDAIISIIISIVIFLGWWKIIKKSGFILMEAVPDELSTEKIHKTILSVENIKEIHEFHLWSISEWMYSLSFHIILNDYQDNKNYEIISKISDLLKETYNIDHITIQIENPEINPHDEQ